MFKYGGEKRKKGLKIFYKTKILCKCVSFYTKYTLIAVCEAVVCSENWRESNIEWTDKLKSSWIDTNVFTSVFLFIFGAWGRSWPSLSEVFEPSEGHRWRWWELMSLWAEFRGTWRNMKEPNLSSKRTKNCDSNNLRWNTQKSRWTSEPLHTHTHTHECDVDWQQRIPQWKQWQAKLGEFSFFF